MIIQNDKALDIALGNSRKTKTWKNKPLLLRGDGYETKFYMKD